VREGGREITTAIPTPPTLTPTTTLNRNNKKTNKRT
jgi:hypothetical protein